MPFLEPDPDCLQEKFADEVHRLTMKRRFAAEYEYTEISELIK